MDGFGTQSLPAILAYCQANLAMLEEKLQTLAANCRLSIGDTGVLTPQVLNAELDGPGLVLRFDIGDQAALLLIPEATQILHAWYANPDASQAALLEALAANLAPLLFPPEITVSKYRVAAVERLADAVRRGDVLTDAPLLRFGVGESPGAGSHLLLIWPIERPEAVFAPPSQSRPQAERSHAAAGPDALHILPSYSRSLLRIKVPVVVTLADQKQSVSKIVEIVPGSILQFRKSCDESLELAVGTQRIALGECVKVGDKFGLRVTNLILPAERFERVTGVPVATP